MESCLFCRIISGEIPAERVGESENFIAIKDIHPKAPVHILILPKRHMSVPPEMTPKERGEIFDLVQQIAEKNEVAKTGYRLVINAGADSGQEVEHLHLHLLGGRKAGAIY